jgi:integrase
VLRDLLVDALIRSEGHELIFARADGRPFSPYTLAARATRHWNDVGCARITLHECRHTFAALMVSAMSAAGKFNAKVLQTLMGHSSITVTFDRYGHLMPGSETEAARPSRSLSRGRRGGCPRRRSDAPREKCGKTFGAAGRSPAVSGAGRRGR